MTKLNFNAVATKLLSQRVAGMKAARLAPELRPTSLEDALQVHAEMIKLRDNKVGGWKCLLPLSEEKHIVAPIFSDVAQRGDICELFADKGNVRVEPEIAFILANDLPASESGYTEEQIDEAIGSCHMALELIQSRFDDESGAEFLEILADGLVNQGVYIGHEIDRTKAYAAEKVNVSLTQATTVQSFNGEHPNTQPVVPIYWLVNYMTRRGVTFSAGQALITGSYCGVVHLDFDKPTHIIYQGIGEYTVTFKERI